MVRRRPWMPVRFDSVTSTSHRAGDDQRALWDHFQTECVESFGDSEARLSYLVSRLSAGSLAVSIGVGDAGFERRAHYAGIQVVAVDPGERSLRHAVGRGDVINATTALIQGLPFASDSIDAVVASEVLEHLGDDTLEAAIAEVGRVLKAGGLFLGTVPREEDLASGRVVCPCCGAVFHKWGHEQSFDAERLHRTLRVGFDQTEVRCRRFVPWRRRNWKGRLVEAVRLGFHRFGVHSDDENLVFEARSPRL